MDNDTSTPPHPPAEYEATPSLLHPPAEAAVVGGGAGEGGEQAQGAWHRLTSYIVQLEKTVREMGGAMGGAQYSGDVIVPC